MAFAACGQQKAPGAARPSPVASAPTSAVDAGPAASAVPALVELAELAAEAPAGSREWDRAELTLVDGRARRDLPAPERDVCVRVAYASDEPVEVAVAAARARGSRGLLPEDGLACLRRGERASVDVSGSGGRARVVVFRLP